MVEMVKQSKRSTEKESIFWNGHIKQSDETAVRKLLPTIRNIYELKDEYLVKFRLSLKIVLGPWELEHTKKIISYTSIAGKAILNHSSGDIVIIGLRKKRKRYKIRKIEQVIL